MRVMQRINDIIDQVIVKFIFLLALVLRIGLMFYGVYQDNNFQVKYTDVDYKVYTDAAERVYNNESPFKRATYRYTPMLAYLMLPNVVQGGTFIWFGKLIFVGADLLVGYLIVQILTFRGTKPGNATLWSVLWLYHPFSIQISTRGNADGIVCALVLLTLYYLMKKNIYLGGFFWGMAVHFKAYPIIYLPALLMFLDPNHLYTNSNKQEKRTFGQCICSLFSYDRIMFSLISGGTFLILLFIFYYMYGWEFIYEVSSIYF
jgi:phosphatidylinositol glycan class M